MSSGANVKYILEHREIVESHVQKHKTTWQPLSSDYQLGEDAPIKVFVRVRPLQPRDEDAGAYSLVEVQESRLIHVTHPTVRWAGGRIATKTYDADGIFSETATNQDVYHGMNLTREISQLLHEDGRELSILAYGQTGTGKTFTTTSLEERIASEIFDLSTADQVIAITLSILEIRGSASFDLLSEPALQPVKIAGGFGSAQFQGLSVHEIRSKEALLQLIRRGRDLRFTRSTSKNDTSSRSHSIVSIKISQQREGLPDIISSINVVDLAGSERSSVIANNGQDRVKESIDTNKSLAALKECIRARLSDKPTHVPWRSDKLTMALKGAFEARHLQAGQAPSRLFVVACISPSVLDIEDSLNTLKYITPFQLSAAKAVDATVRQSDLGFTDDPRTWGHAQSKVYITRTMLKIATLADRLLPEPSETIASLFPLSVQDLEKRCATPAPGEASAPDSRIIAASRGWIPSYHKKLQDVAARCAEIDRRAKEGVKPSGVAARASGGVTQGRGRKGGVLGTLNGTDPNANETGFVQRIAADGKAWDAIEKLEKANK